MIYCCIKVRMKKGECGMFGKNNGIVSDSNKTYGLEKIDRAKRLGYNICYKVNNEGVIEYNIESVKAEVRMNVGTAFEKNMYQIIEEGNYTDFRAMLRKYDYRERAKNENAKCTVVFLGLMIETIDRVIGKEKGVNVYNSWVEMLEDFTNYRVSSMAGRCIEFSDLVRVTQYAAENLNISDEFFNVVMDYIMNIILKYEI